MESEREFLISKETVDLIIEGLVEKLGSNEGTLDIFCVKLDNALNARLLTIEAKQDRIIAFIEKVEAASEQIPVLIEELKQHPIFGSLLGGFEVG